ncbi:TMEM43 family protein [Patescibacteria group bacterium]
MAKNFGDRLVGSIGLLLVGVLVFIGSLVILYYSEGRTDYSILADKAIELEGEVDEEAFVFVTDGLNSLERLGDDLYLEPGDYIAFNRTIEMFAWVEDKHTDEGDDYYTYDTKWVDEVPNSSEFDQPRHHENTTKAFDSIRETVSEGKVGKYELDMKKVRLPGLSPHKVSEEIIDSYLYIDSVSDGDKDYIFDGYGEYGDPEIGDVRISYSVLEPIDEVTVFGRPDGDKLRQHHGEKESGLYRVFEGTKYDAISTLKGEYKAAGWMGRIFGFIVMWIGLMLILKPLSVSLEVIPFVANLGKSTLAVIAFVTALILTAIASFVLSILNGVGGLIAIAVVVVLIGLYLNTKKQEANTKKPKAPGHQ